MEPSRVSNLFLGFSEARWFPSLTMKLLFVNLNDWKAVYFPRRKLPLFWFLLTKKINGIRPKLGVRQNRPRWIDPAVSSKVQLDKCDAQFRPCLSPPPQPPPNGQVFKTLVPEQMSAPSNTYKEINNLKNELSPFCFPIVAFHITAHVEKSDLHVMALWHQARGSEHTKKEQREEERHMLFSSCPQAPGRRHLRL